MMEAYDNLPHFLREFYAHYPLGTPQMKRVHMAWHFDDPYESLLLTQLDAELKIHEMLFNVTLSRRPVPGYKGDLYHPTISLNDGHLFRDARTD